MKKSDEVKLHVQFEKELVALFNSMTEATLIELDLRGGRLCVQFKQGPFRPHVVLSLGDPDDSSCHDENFVEKILVSGEERQTLAAYVHTKFSATQDLEFDEEAECYIARDPSIVRSDALKLAPALAEDLAIAFVQHPRLQEAHS